MMRNHENRAQNDKNGENGVWAQKRFQNRGLGKKRVFFVFLAWLWVQKKTGFLGPDPHFQFVSNAPKIGDSMIGLVCRWFWTGFGGYFCLTFRNPPKKHENFWTHSQGFCENAILRFGPKNAVLPIFAVFSIFVKSWKSCWRFSFSWF